MKATNHIALVKGRPMDTAEEDGVWGSGCDEAYSTTYTDDLWLAEDDYCLEQHACRGCGICGCSDYSGGGQRALAWERDL